MAHRPGAQRPRRLPRRHRHPRLQSRLPSSPACNVEELAADLSIFVPGRRLDDNVQSCCATPREHAACYGRARSRPATRTICACASTVSRRRSSGAGRSQLSSVHPVRRAAATHPPQRRRRGPVAAHASRIPAGHPEGYIEAFAQLYTDLAEQISAHIEKRAPDPASLLVPGIADGVAGMRFIEGALESSRRNAAWIRLI